MLIFCDHLALELVVEICNFPARNCYDCCALVELGRKVDPLRVQRLRLLGQRLGRPVLLGLLPNLLVYLNQQLEARMSWLGRRR